MIVLISDTPVAGTVERLTKWIKASSGIETKALIFNNYAHHAFVVNSGTISFMEDWHDYVRKVCKDASCVIFHNVLNNELIDVVFSSTCHSVPKLYQIHSPPFEGPQFTYNIIDEYPFDGILKISQGHGRFLDDGILVPNVIDDFSIDHYQKRHNHILVPHIRTTSHRWSNKICKDELIWLENNKSLISPFKLKTLPTMFGRSNISHEELLFSLNSVKAVIDDINTGLIHQTALEGLKSGCAVFSNADLETIDQFCSTIDAPVPPFIFVNNSFEIVDFFKRNCAINEIELCMSKSLKYSNEFLKAERLASYYCKKISPYIK